MPLLHSSLLRTLPAAVLFTASLPIFAQAPSRVEEDRFVHDLLSRMTLEEKIGQMSQVALNTKQSTTPEEQVRAGQVGSFLFVQDPARIHHLQEVAVNESRLHIPILFGFDVIHGFRTVYPIPLAMAATWDPAAVEHAQRMAAREARAAGIQWTFAPMVDIARDARWGRMLEGAGEDPYLGARMAEAQVRGFQGSKLDSGDNLLACLKHFAGYGAATGGRDYEESNISDEQLWNVYLPPFEAGVKAGAGSVMPAYMDLNDVPAVANSWLLHDVLRQHWHFDGFTVSDWEAVKSTVTQGFSRDDADAAARAANAGTEMEMTSHDYRDHLAADVKVGLVAPGVLDSAVLDILRAKYRLGLFRQPYSPVDSAEKEVLSSEQRTASRVTAERAAVLLRNEGSLLPLKRSGTIALIGPLADTKQDIAGSWSLASRPAANVTLLEGLRGYAAAHAGMRIVSTGGVEIERGNASIFDEQYSSPKPKLHTDAERDAEFRHAIDLVRSADVAVLALGETQDMSGERASRMSLSLPGRQQQLMEAAVATGKPVVIVLMNARPLDLNWASEHVPAILDVWYPGTEGGNAIANLLFGDAVPGGKLPVTWPRSAGQEPLYYGKNLTQIADAPDTRYWDGSSAPLYRFGYGLSYSTFTIHDVKLSAPTISPSGSVDVSCTLTNTGKYAADDVVEVYTHQRAGSASRPIRELKGFRRVTLKPGEQRIVTLTVHADDLAFWSPQTRARAVEPGSFDLWLGDSSAATEHVSFEITR